MAICRLCAKERALRNSHIIPEFLWKPLYDNTNSFFAVTGEGIHGYRKLQKGLREHLFCEPCEQFFNDSYEKPFLRFWRKEPCFRTAWREGATTWIECEYADFKLFHLSILFRAHVSSLRDFSNVSLGPHAERIRRMLVSKNPGGVGEYPIFGYVVLHPDTGLPVIDMVSTPKVSNLERSKCYAIVYGGVNWHFFVASHRSNKIEDMSLRADNRIPLWSKRMDTIAEIKEKAIAYIDKQKQNSRF